MPRVPVPSTSAAAPAAVSAFASRTLRARRCAAVTLLGVAVLAGCGGSGGSSGSSSSHAGRHVDIVIKNFKFKPASLTVRPGAKVTVTNKDSVPHTVTAKDKAKSFDTGNIAHGKTVTFKAPSKKGTYRYICTVHPYMKGTLTTR